MSGTVTVFGSQRWHEMARMLEFESKQASDPDDVAALERSARYIRRLGDEDAAKEEEARHKRLVALRSKREGHS